jgi:hypothetical protein
MLCMVDRWWQSVQHAPHPCLLCYIIHPKAAVVEYLSLISWILSTTPVMLLQAYRMHAVDASQTSCRKHTLHLCWKVSSKQVLPLRASVVPTWQQSGLMQMSSRASTTTDSRVNTPFVCCCPCVAAVHPCRHQWYQLGSKLVQVL